METNLPTGASSTTNDDARPRSEARGGREEFSTRSESVSVMRLGSVGRIALPTYLIGLLTHS